MRAMRVVVLDVFPEKRPQVTLVQHDEMVQTVIAEGPDHAFRNSIRPGGSNRTEQRLDAKAFGTLGTVTTINAIAVAEQETRFPAPGCRLHELTPDPGRGGWEVTLKWMSSRRSCAMKKST